MRVLMAWLLLSGCGLPMAWDQLPQAPLALDNHPAGIANFHRVADPQHPTLQLYRSGLPSLQDWPKLKQLGIRIDINLLSSDGNDAALVAQEKAVTASLGIRHIQLPLPWGVEPPRAMVETFLTTVRSANGQGVLVHCKHGKDRTGEMVAAWRIRENGYSYEEALEEMMRYGYDPKPFPWVTEFVFNFARQYAPKGVPVSTPPHAKLPA